MSELSFPVIPDKCRRCPFLREMKWTRESLENYRQERIGLATYVCNAELDETIQKRLTEEGVELVGDPMSQFRKELAAEIDEGDSSVEEVIGIALAAAIACQAGPVIREAVIEGQRHVISRCSSPHQINPEGMPYYDIVPADIDWVTETV